MFLMFFFQISSEFFQLYSSNIYFLISNDGFRCARRVFQFFSDFSVLSSALPVLKIFFSFCCFGRMFFVFFTFYIFFLLKFSIAFFVKIFFYAGVFLGSIFDWILGDGLSITDWSLGLVSIFELVSYSWRKS